MAFRKIEISDDLIETMVREYTQDKLTVREIAARHHLGYGAVRTRLIGAGVTFRPRWERPIP